MVCRDKCHVMFSSLHLQWDTQEKEGTLSFSMTAHNLRKLVIERAPVLGRLLQELRQRGHPMLRLLLLMPPARPACAIRCPLMTVLSKHRQQAQHSQGVYQLQVRPQPTCDVTCRAGQQLDRHQSLSWLSVWGSIVVYNYKGTGSAVYHNERGDSDRRRTSAQGPVLRQELREQVGVRPPLTAGSQLRAPTESWSFHQQDPAQAMARFCCCCLPQATSPQAMDWRSSRPRKKWACAAFIEAPFRPQASLAALSGNRLPLLSLHPATQAFGTSPPALMPKRSIQHTSPGSPPPPPICAWNAASRGSMAGALRVGSPGCRPPAPSRPPKPPPRPLCCCAWCCCADAARARQDCGTFGLGVQVDMQPHSCDQHGCWHLLGLLP